MNLDSVVLGCQPADSVVVTEVNSEIVSCMGELLHRHLFFFPIREL